jgi:hypothetical protein
LSFAFYLFALPLAWLSRETCSLSSRPEEEVFERERDLR